ncbi:neutral/alkaline non-lysosomal ceramidase N-terminal domain-containing protein [Lutimonas zeaxanthinifaciens]|uniref:neutral/alkaline non-lysosomal ceramidase N-terminal domain-containing protein n=1 Tax=Lutimonas zeaxanthinifaciens TaxID=3060215 RepID=UPI00265D5747|nr:neutral/alkaline non-lysosomal ceramidase N-terminal domain-containing protein [Lutimonas sp. YSD2104]WKK67033.1 neutral/alkaline non-lysosomal ceramidase N-terminal domain-containing protein [Lutimonas sp. YSD2104]
MDTWNDVDNNARYEPENGDTFNDNNKNGKFDAFWIAGFDNRRAANGVHDQLWARTMILDDGTSRMAIVSLDAIGFFHDQVIEVRKRLKDELGIDYCMIASTHVHEAPDLMGIWGESEYKSGINKEYLEFVINQTVKSVEDAIKDLEPVQLHFAKGEEETTVTDTRKPFVRDSGIYIIQAKNEKGDVKGTLVSWANHPETLWSKNLLLSSDFPHYLRKNVEEKSGGICVYLNGAIGGLMTTHPDVEVTHPTTGNRIKEPSFQKAEAQGLILSENILNALKNSTDSIREGSIALSAKTFNLPMDNDIFKLGLVAGVLDRGMVKRWEVRTEMAAWGIGPASFLTIPGEIYPEIILGGIDTPKGQDIHVSAVEIPPLQSKMPRKYQFVIGQANDALGYIIPKSQWDNKEPWTYGDEQLYGEVNSLGPETAPLIHGKGLELLNDIK